MIDLICVDNSYKEINMHQWGPGVREVFVLHYIISGSGTYKTGGREFSLSAGDVFLIYPGVECYYYPDENDPWEYRWIDFRGQEAEKMIERSVFSREAPVVRHQDYLAKMFEIYDEETPLSIAKERFAARLYLLLTYFLREDHVKLKASEEYIHQAISYIHDYYWNSKVNVSTLSEALHVERSYLYRLFMKFTNQSPASYLTQYRMEKACNFLKETKNSVKSIACSVGYEDPLYFSKVFKKEMGMTPGDYRNSTQLPLSR